MSAKKAKGGLTPEQADLHVVLQDFAGFMSAQAEKGNLMPSSTEVFILSRIAILDRRLSKLENPPIIKVVP